MSLEKFIWEGICRNTDLTESMAEIAQFRIHKILGGHQLVMKCALREQETFRTFVPVPSHALLCVLVRCRVFSCLAVSSRALSCLLMPCRIFSCHLASFRAIAF